MGYDIEDHPDTGAPLVAWDGGVHGLGLKPRNLSAYNGRYPPLGSRFPTLPQAQWTEQDFRPFCVPVLDQGQTSSCLPHSVVEAMGLAFAFVGDEKPILSAWFLYSLINGGSDNGSSLPDALHAAETVGVPPDSLVKHGNMFGPYSADAKQQAARFKIEAAYDSPTFAELCSSLERAGNVPVIGVDIGSAFEPDGNGVIPPFRSDPRGIMGHAITVVGKKKLAAGWHLLIQNHWTKQWGMAGFAYLPASYIAPQFGAWTLRTVRDDPNDATPSPAAG